MGDTASLAQSLPRFAQRWSARNRAARAQSGVFVEIDRRLQRLMVQQVKTGAAPTLAVLVMILLLAPTMPNGEWLILIAVLRAIAAGHNLIYADRLAAQMAAGKSDQSTFRQVAGGCAVSVFLSGAIIWPLAIGSNLDFAAFLVITIALLSVCLSVIVAGYHPRTLVAVTCGGALGLGPKIAALSLVNGPLVAFGFAIYLATIIAYARTAGRQVRGAVLLEMRNQSMSLRLNETNQALEETLHRAQWLADHDSLTELLNRRACERELSTFTRRFAHRRCMVMLLDIDHFKTINDRFGHETGDGVLLAIGTCLTQWEEQASGRMVGRWGGEEFIAVAALRPNEQPQHFAELLRLRIFELGEKLHWPGQVNLSTSIGCAMLSSLDEVDAALRDADAALYLAKDAGRNCWKIAA